jgi:hypothetical protein
MPVGDVNSNSLGSGARYNDGKPELAQIPLEYWRQHVDVFVDEDVVPFWVALVLRWWERYQRTGEAECLKIAFSEVPVEEYYQAARVLTYGAQKYDQWNWTKGMAWSIPFNCGLRHLDAFLRGEEYDEESNCTHLGHFICNVMMLDWYVSHYPEGEDWVKIEEPIDA